MNDTDTQMHIFEPFLLLGLLANYNKFEIQNPYQLRLDDFVNETTIQKIVKGAGTTCGLLRNAYVAVQDDMPEGWSTNFALFVFRAFVRGGKSSNQQLTPEETAKQFAMLYVNTTLSARTEAGSANLYKTVTRSSDSSFNLRLHQFK